MITFAMRWLVELCNTAGSERLLSDILRRFSLEVIEMDGVKYLRGKPLEGNSAPQEVYAVAKRIEDILKESATRPPYPEASFSVGGKVLDLSVPEPARTCIFVRGASSVQANYSSGGAVSVGPTVAMTDEERLRQEEERLRQEKEQREHEYQRVLELTSVAVLSAFADENALMVQRLLAAPLQPLELGHIAEIIESDLGGLKRNLASIAEWTRFNRSINHPVVFGQAARHIVTSQDPPPRPMDLGEATAFIRRVSAEWLKGKAGFDGKA